MDMWWQAQVGKLEYQKDLILVVNMPESYETEFEVVKKRVGSKRVYLSGLELV